MLFRPAAIAIVTTLVSVSGVYAQTVVRDQFNPVASPGSARAIASGFTWFQTFTVGTAGRLDRIEVPITPGRNATEDLTAAIFSTDANGAPLDVLAVVSLTAANVSPVASVSSAFDFRAESLAFQTGDNYAIRLTSSAFNTAPDFSQRYNWVNGLPYAGGSAFSDGPPNDRDFAFATYMLVPEPSGAVTLLVAGVAVLQRRRRGETRAG